VVRRLPTTDGTGGALTRIADGGAVTTAVGFLRRETYTSVDGDIKLGNRVYKGILKNSVITAANGGALAGAL